MKRAIVIGCPGAGKSTFSRKLHKATGLPLYYLDMLWHKSDKSNYTRGEFDGSLSKILAQDEWIIDGNYIRTLEMRLKCCDTVFLLDFPVELCIESVEARIGTEREDMPWVEEDFDEEFRQWILDFPKEQLPEIYRLLDKYKDKVNMVVFKTREEMNIRRATENDLDEIMSIWLDANIQAHSFISKKYWQSHYENVRVAISEAEVYVYDDGDIKGFVGLVENYIAGIFVREEFQSQGIGGELIHFIQNLKTTLSLSVYEKNENAVKFYLKHGFQISDKSIEEETGYTEYQMIWR